VMISSMSLLSAMQEAGCNLSRVVIADH